MINETSLMSPGWSSDFMRPAWPTFHRFLRDKLYILPWSFPPWNGPSTRTNVRTEARCHNIEKLALESMHLVRGPGGDQGWVRVRNNMGCKKLKQNRWPLCWAIQGKVLQKAFMHPQGPWKGNERHHNRWNIYSQKEVAGTSQNWDRSITTKKISWNTVVAKKILAYFVGGREI